MEPWIYIVAVVLSYLVGGFPSGVVLSKRKYGIDVRAMGSGNIGATNVTRVFGWYAGVLTFVIDFCKGFFPLYLCAKYYSPDVRLISSIGFFLVFGHCFSPYLKFNGGKGVATSFGVFAFIFPFGAMVAGGTYALLLALTRISAVGSLGGIIALIGALFFKDLSSDTIYLVLSVSLIVVIRHRQNIERMIKRK